MEIFDWLLNTQVAAIALILLLSFLIIILSLKILIRFLQERPEGISEIARVILGQGYFSVVIENKKVNGKDKAIKRLATFGGPGELIVYSGQIVVLHRHGKISRAVGQGSVMLKRFEKIKAILPLTPQGGVQNIENVMTRDRISLNLKVLHAARVEPASDTKERLQKALDEALAELQAVRSGPPTPEELEKAQQDVRDAEQKLKDLEQDPIIGDDYDQVYESIAKLVGMRAPNDIWGGVKFPIASNVKDAIMAEHSENLFKIESDNGDLKTRIYERKIKELEDYIKDASTGSALGKGIKLLTVDFNEIHFPKQSTVTAKTEINLVETDTSYTAEQRGHYLRKLLSIHEENLQEVEEQLALHGTIDRPLKLINEKKRLEVKVRETKLRIEELEKRQDP